VQHPRQFFVFRPGGDVVRILLAQALAGMLGAVLAGVFFGLAAFASALVGAAAYGLPNAVFALRLLLGLAATGQASVVTFFVGQFIKVGLTVTVLMLAAWLGKSWLVWPALLWGLCCVLMGYLLLPLASRWQRRWSE